MCVRLNKSFVMEVVGVVAAFDSREIGNKGLSVKATEGHPTNLLSSQYDAVQVTNIVVWDSEKVCTITIMPNECYTHIK